MDAGIPPMSPGPSSSPGTSVRLAGVAMPDPTGTTGAWITGLVVDAGPAGITVLWPDGVRRWDVPWTSVVSAGRGAPGRYSDGTPNETLDVTTADRTVHLVAPTSVLTAGAFSTIAAARVGGAVPTPVTPAAPPAPQAPLPPLTPVGSAGPAPTAWSVPGPSGWQAAPAEQPSPWSDALVPAPAAVAGSPAHRREGRARRLALLVAAVVLVVAAVGGVAVALGRNQRTDALTGKTPVQVVALSQAAAVRSGSFHYVSTSRFTDSSGTSTMTTVGDADKTAGTQQITAGPDIFTIDVVGAGVYFKGNAAALREQLGLTAAGASANVGKWISLAPTDAPTSSVEAGVTSSDFFTAPCLLQPGVSGTPVAVNRGTVAGTPVGMVQCAIHSTTGAGSTAVTSTGTGTLSVAVARPNLPVRSTSAATTTGPSDSGSGTSVVDFSDWGETVMVSAPAGAIPYSSLPVQTTPPTQTQPPSSITA